MASSAATVVDSRIHLWPCQWWRSRKYWNIEPPPQRQTCRNT